MILISIINKWVRSKGKGPITPELKQLGDEISTMSKDPKWKAYMDKINKDGLSKEDKEWFDDEFNKSCQ